MAMIKNANQVSMIWVLRKQFEQVENDIQEWMKMTL
jgi:hypothetical protein